MNCDIFVFDFDGTVARSERGITSCVRYTLERMGRPAPGMDVLKRFIGPPLYTAFREYCGMDDADAVRAVALYRERYSAEGLFEAEIYAGVTPLLRALKRRGARVAVASGKPEPFLRRIIDRFGLTPFIDAVAGPSMGSHSPDKTAQVLQVLGGAEPARACMIGDRSFDMEAGRALGMRTVGAAYGYGTREELENAGAEQVADTVEALQQILLDGEGVGRGFMISFEGTDGCGKSTQLRKLGEALSARGYEIVSTREPGGCPVSERIREIILSLDSKGMSAECEALLYAAARAEHVRQVILPALNSGKIVLCDRFLDSSIAYQAYGRELGEDFIRQINKVAANAVVPDCTLQFDVDREAARARMAQGAPLDRLESEKEDFFARVARGYARVAQQEPGRIHRVDSGRSIEEVFADVLEIVLPAIDSK